MEETQNSTPVETTEVQTPLESDKTSQPESQTPENADQEPVKNDVEAAENVEEGNEAKAQEPKEINWEQRAKENQASFTRVSQEKAELTKRIEELENQLKPKMVENGRINPKFEQKYTMSVDNEEFLAFDSLARELGPESRAEVEKLLREAQSLYNPSNKSAYNAKLNQVKDYFRSDIVETIALKKQELQGQMKEAFDKELAKERQERADKIAAEIGQIPELNDLLTPESKNYSEEVFGLVKTIFDLTGTVDTQGFLKAINAVKALGVKEYQANQQAEAERKKATVPSGETVLQKQASNEVTAEYATKNYQKCLDDFQKNGLSFKDAMAKVDAIIMKG